MQKWFQNVCREYAHRTFLFPNFTYGDLKNLSDVHARQTYHDIPPRQYAIIHGSNSPDMLARIFAVERVGAIPFVVPPNTRIKGTPQPLDDEALVLTTPQKKVVRFSQENMLSAIDMFRQHVPKAILSSEDRTYSFLPWMHTAGLMGECFSVMDRGASCVVSNIPPHPSYLIRNFHQTHPTLIYIPRPLLEEFVVYNQSLRKFVKHAKDRKRILFGGEMRYMISAPVSMSTRMEMWHNLKVPILHKYGCAEMCSMISMQTEFDPHDESVGTPFPGVDLEFTNEHEILASGKNKCLGVDKHHTTGDLGFIKDDKLFIMDQPQQLSA